MSQQVITFFLLHILLTILIVIIFYVAIYVVLKRWLKSRIGFCISTERLDGKVVLVTGGDAGIGLETARGLAKRGAKVIIASRNQQRSEEAIADIIETTGNYNVEYRHLDLSKFSSVRNFAEDFNRSFSNLDILVNNAAVFAINDVTEDGIHIILQTNYYAPFLLTMLLMKKLIASRPSRIINVSSNARVVSNLNNIYGINSHHSRVQCNSKTFMMLWSRALAKRLPNGVTVNTLYPGLVVADAYETMPKCIKQIFTLLIGPLTRTPEEGAQTTLHLCVSKEVRNITGGYFEDCKLAPYNMLINDDEAAEKVWNQSIMVTKLDNSLTVFDKDIDGTV